jgi:hypothetical protein
MGPARNGRGEFVVTIDNALRDAEAAQLAAKRVTYRQIAAQMGYSGPGKAHEAVQRALARAGRDSVLESRQLMLDHLDQLAQIAWGVLEANHYAISQGKVVRLGNQPLKDSRPVLEALDRLVAIEDKRARILGVYAAKRVEVFTHDSVDAAIQELEGKLASGAAAAARHPG